MSSGGVAVLVFGVALVATWLARRYAVHRRLMDLPGERRSHVVATPRGGGVAIVVALLPVFAWLAYSRGASWPLAGASALGLVLVAGIGWVDDHRPLSPWIRLGTHVVAGLLLAAGMAWAGQPLWWCAVVCVLAIGLVNVWNFMDGIDGIATTQAMLVGAGVLVLAPVAGLPLAVIAACAGFLPFNFPRARIFLGDVGSGGLGYLVACLLAWHVVSLPEAALLLLPLSAFMIDAALTLLSRILRGERWWTPHVQHLYQRFVHHGAPHVAVTSGYAVWTLLAIFLAAALVGHAWPVIIGALTTWYLLTATLWFLLRARLSRRTPGLQG